MSFTPHRTFVPPAKVKHDMHGENMRTISPTHLPSINGPRALRKEIETETAPDFDRAPEPPTEIKRVSTAVAMPLGTDPLEGTIVEPPKNARPERKEALRIRVLKALIQAPVSLSTEALHDVLGVYGKTITTTIQKLRKEGLIEFDPQAPQIPNQLRYVITDKGTQALIAFGCSAEDLQPVTLPPSQTLRARVLAAYAVAGEPLTVASVNNLLNESGRSVSDMAGRLRKAGYLEPAISTASSLRDKASQITPTGISWLRDARYTDDLFHPKYRRDIPAPIQTQEPPPVKRIEPDYTPPIEITSAPEEDAKPEQPQPLTWEDKLKAFFAPALEQTETVPLIAPELRPQVREALGRTTAFAQLLHDSDNEISKELRLALTIVNSVVCDALQQDEERNG